MHRCAYNPRWTDEEKKQHCCWACQPRIDRHLADRKSSCANPWPWVKDSPVRVRILPPRNTPNCPSSFLSQALSPFPFCSHLLPLGLSRNFGRGRALRRPSSPPAAATTTRNRERTTTPLCLCHPSKAMLSLLMTWLRSVQCTCPSSRSWLQD